LEKLGVGTLKTLKNHGATPMTKPNPFSIGERVVLKACTDFPGTVTGFERGRVEVLFDDFRNDAPKAFRPESLQLAKRVPGSVPKSDVSGTRILLSGHREESGVCRAACSELFGTEAKR
jgi:hypothetical protein